MLSDRDQAILDLAARPFPRGGRYEAAIRDELDMAPTLYFAALGRLLDDPDALAYAPVLVNRLRRLREERRRVRGARVRLG